MKHNHKEECKHEKLTYCKECDVVECECGREWEKKEIPLTVNPSAPITEGTIYNRCPTCGQWVPFNSTHTCIPNITWTCSHKQ